MSTNDPKTKLYDPSYDYTRGEYKSLGGYGFGNDDIEPMPLMTKLPTRLDYDKHAPEEGRKFDGGKLEYGLLPPKALEETVKVLTFGAQKYARDNWKFVDDAKRRYFDALQRHLWAWKNGEELDPESGIHHLGHAMCCLMFLYEHDTIYSIDN